VTLPSQFDDLVSKRLALGEKVARLAEPDFLFEGRPMNNREMAALLFYHRHNCDSLLDDLIGFVNRRCKDSCHVSSDEYFPPERPQARRTAGGNHAAS
jgi:hypothetical protein